MIAGKKSLKGGLPLQPTKFGDQSKSASSGSYLIIEIFLALFKNKIIFRFVPECQCLSLTPGFFPKKFCRFPGLTHWTILEKEVLDEIIFRTAKSGNRLILELMARRGMTTRDTVGSCLYTVYTGQTIRLTGNGILIIDPLSFSGALVPDPGETQPGSLVAGGRHIPDTQS